MPKKKEDVPKEFKKETFHNWVKNYVRENKKYPELFILFRENVSNAERKDVLKEEI